MKIELLKYFYDHNSRRTISILLFGVFMCMGSQSYSQSTLTISGEVQFPDGSPAIEAGIILTFETTTELSDFTVTNTAGLFSFMIDLPIGFEEECFDVTLLNCDGFFLSFTDCFTTEDLDFEFDFVFCEYGNSFCSSFITTTPVDEDNIELSVLQFGIGPYTYEWNDGSTDSTRVLPLTIEGTYCVSVTSADDCISEACITLEPVEACFVFISESNGFESTTLLAEGFGATGDLGYLWSTGDETESIQVTEDGEYCVTVSDNTGCMAEECLIVEVDSSGWLDCFAEINLIEGIPDQLLALASGVGPFQYIWTKDDVFIDDSEAIEVTESGMYCVEISDTEDCIHDACFDYTFVSDCSVTFIWSQPEGIPQLTADIDGIPPFIYSWNTGSEDSSIIIENSGFYCVSIEDSTGCESSFCEFVDVSLFDECNVEIVSQVINENNAQLTVLHSTDIVTEGFSYLWSNGETGEIINVSEAGFYCVFVLSDLGCEFETCVYVSLEQINFNEGLVISYINTETQLGENGIIELYEVDNGTAYLYDVLERWPELDTDGLYYTNSILDGTYLVRAIPDASDEYIPSYSQKIPFWEESEFVTVENGGAGLQSIVNILTIPIEEVSGNGGIAGTSFFQVADINIMLFQNNVPVRQVFINPNEEFIFENLPYGTYTVIQEIPGLMREEIVVVLSENVPFEGGVFFDGGLVSVNESLPSKFAISPNPTANTLNIQSEMINSGSFEIRIMDVNGRMMEVIFTEDNLGTGAVLDLSGFDSGVYFISINNDQHMETQKVIKI